MSHSGASLNGSGSPGDPADAQNELGIALARQGRNAEAEQTLRRAVAMRPAHAGGWNNLANVLRRLGRLDDTERAHLTAVALAPEDGELQLALGHFWRQCGRAAQAAAAYGHAARLMPGSAEALRCLGDALRELGRVAEALPVLRKAAALAPGMRQVFLDIGYCHRQLDRDADAEASFAEALRHDPADADGHANLASLMADQGRVDEARRHALEAVRLRPAPRLRVLSATVMPVVCGSVEEIDQARERFDRETKALADEGVRLDPTAQVVPNHFFLAYHGRDDRPLMERVAALADGPRAHKPPVARPPRRDRIRVGFLSKYLKAHTIGQLNKGLITRLDRGRFEVVLLMIDGVSDVFSREIAQAADRVVPVAPPVPAALAAVAAEELDILFYPELGMDPLTYTLAHSRLAPVQAATWGHPDTSGLKTIDLFVSSADLDPPGNEKYYTERLHRLPRLATWYERPEAPAAVRREEFGLPGSGALFGCPQSLFKFHPDFDAVIRRVLGEVPGSHLVLLEGTNPRWRGLLRSRLERTLGPLAGRVVWVPRCSREAFLRLNACCDIMLDPVHFGGGNTTYEALALGKPVVTWPSPFLRGRLSLAMYRQMGYSDLVAESFEDYAALAIRLARDEAFRRHASETIGEKSEILYRDDEAVRAFGQFLREAAGR
jgi:predicted O-linked N-acetylglucosamine transferase (SPINDLY family)